MQVGDIIRLRWGSTGRLMIARVLSRNYCFSQYSWSFDHCGRRYQLLDKEMTACRREVYVSKLIRPEDVQR